jgi:hypothetical protein
MASSNTFFIVLILLVVGLSTLNVSIQEEQPDQTTLTLGNGIQEKRKVKIQKIQLCILDY